MRPLPAVCNAPPSRIQFANQVDTRSTPVSPTGNQAAVPSFEVNELDGEGNPTGKSVVFCHLLLVESVEVMCTCEDSPAIATIPAYDDILSKCDEISPASLSNQSFLTFPDLHTSETFPTSRDWTRLESTDESKFK
ncbi:hypothetical protein CSKR_201121 [Clonorchis sinensis]|uniref:Uncharacterized protein n=1 Tax=Clonorchis sinensis TaxID=79923 RepID=A0A8T1MMH5_CLOSI|nr:hypothetical protein CSKR_201121 [Clonorchis sinensis]